jgi:hypothetical protein
VKLLLLALIAVVCLPCAHTAFAECIEVTSVPEFVARPSPPTAAVTINRYGSPFPGATMVGGKAVARIISDEHGHFSVRLPAGKYVAVLMVPGFSSRFPIPGH